MCRACADAGRTREALEILDDDLSGRRGVNGFSYSSIMDTLARQASLVLLVFLHVVAEGRRWSPFASSPHRLYFVCFWFDAAVAGYRSGVTFPTPAAWPSQPVPACGMIVPAGGMIFPAFGVIFPACGIIAPA